VKLSILARITFTESVNRNSTEEVEEYSGTTEEEELICDIEEDETKTSDTVEHETNSSVTEEDEGGVNCSVTEKLKRKSNMQR